MITLRDYQHKAISDIRSEYARGAKSVCLTAPCGAGKTVIFSKIAELATVKNTRIAIVVHRDSLLLQASEKLTSCGLAHGIIAPGYTPSSHGIQVASLMTLSRRLEKWEFDLLILDECHHALSPTYRKLIDRWASARVLGVTATPCRTSGHGLDAVFQKLVLGPDISALIKDGYLVEPVTYGPSHALDLSKIGTKAGEYDLNQLAKHMDDPRITGDAVEKYRSVCPGVPAMVFTVNVKHAEDVAAAFSAGGFRAASIDGKMPTEIIRQRIAALSTGEIQVLASCSLVSEGTDIPNVVCAIMLRPTRSLSLSIQQGGRALRPVYATGHDLSTRAGRLAAIAAGPKPRAIILDHAGNVYRFMTVDEPHEWTLEGRKKKKRGPVVFTLTECPKCHDVHKPAPVCPGCGYEYPYGVATPNEVGGDLAPIDKAALRRAKWKEVAQARTIDQLKIIAKNRGYHPGWPYHIMRERAAKVAR